MTGEERKTHMAIQAIPAQLIKLTQAVEALTEALTVKTKEEEPDGHAR